MKTLALLKLEVLHENCWTHHLDSGETSPVKVMSLYRERDKSKRKTSTYVIVKGGNEQLDTLLRSDYLYDYKPSVLGIVNKDRKNMAVLVKFEFRHNNSLYNVAFENLLFRDVLYRNNHELWHLIGSTTYLEKHVQQIVEEIGEVGKVVRWEIVTGDQVMDSFFSKSLDFYFSEAQISNLMRLYDSGFFNFPRDLTIEQAASQLNISKGYISKLVRNAQKTIFGRYSNDDYDTPLL